MRRRDALTRLLMPLLAWVLFCLSSPAHATRQYDLTFEQLGQNQTMRLLGVDGYKTLAFAIPPNEAVQQASIHLLTHFSEALIRETSHLKVYLNDEVAAVLPVPENASAGQAQQYDVSLPIWMLQSYNVLKLQLIGHYTWQCENPFDSRLWADIEPRSRLSLEVDERPLPDELSILPAPFIHPLDPSPILLSFVLADKSPATLEAAGIAASWFGVLAHGRKMQFSVSDGALPPQGHAIVIQGASGNPSWIDQALAPATGSQVQIMAHPDDPFGKVLVIRGDDAAQLKNAARALALGADTLTGPQARIDAVSESPRKPYDAPAWLPTDRPVRLGELDVLGGARTVPGFRPDPITLAFNLPPDLYAWQDRRVPLWLKSRYTLQANPQPATLQVQINHDRVLEFELPSNRDVAGARTRGVSEEALELPLTLLGSRGTLGFLFDYHIPPAPECANAIADVFRSEIDANSTLDFSDFQHFIRMPNLAAFATSGFPYSRMADLSESAIVMDANPENDEIQAYLALMSHVAAVTGYPSSRLTVMLGDAQKDALADKDVLILNAGPMHPLLQEWSSHFPSPTERFRDTSILDRLTQWVRSFAGSPEQSIHAARDQGLVMLTGFRSPLNDQRSVVALMSAQASQLAQGVHLFLDQGEIMAEIQGGIAVVDAQGAHSWLTDGTYYLGSLGTWRYLRWLFNQNPVSLMILMFLGVLLLSTMMYLALRTQARRRLNPPSRGKDGRK